MYDIGMKLFKGAEEAGGTMSYDDTLRIGHIYHGKNSRSKYVSKT